MRRALVAGLAVLLFAPVAGFFLFLGQVHWVTGAKPEKADVVVAFSGDPRRIIVATELLKKGFGRRLIIVGQDNQQEVASLRAANPRLFQCCVRADHSSLNTTQDAELVRTMMPTSSAQSVLMVTSSFHVPRARNELRKSLPEAEITAYGIPDEFYRPDQVFSDPRVASGFVSQYLMYIASWIPGDRQLAAIPGARRVLRGLSDVKTLAAIAIGIVTLLFLIFAASKHRQQSVEHSSRRRSGPATRRGE